MLWQEKGFQCVTPDLLLLCLPFGEKILDPWHERTVCPLQNCWPKLKYMSCDGMMFSGRGALPKADWGRVQKPGGWVVQLVVQLAFLNFRRRPNHDISSSVRPKLLKSASNTYFWYRIPTILAAVDSFIYQNLGLLRYHKLVHCGYQKT